MHLFKAPLATVLLLALAGCQTPPAPVTAESTPTRLPLAFQAQDKMGWESVVFPGKLRTEFRQLTHDGRRSVQAESVGSASMLRRRLNITPEQLGALRFEWQVDNLLEGANLQEQGRGDSPVRLVLAFDGDRQRFSARNAMLSELTRALTGEDMPYATLMYVWSNRLPVGTVIVHPRTDRVRKIVVESGSERLRQWLHYERDLRADFERAFGEPPGPLQAVGIMTDSDNTQGRTRAWYGRIAFDAAKAVRD
jgi:hypothetical protein